MREVVAAVFGLVGCLCWFVGAWWNGMVYRLVVISASGAIFDVYINNCSGKFTKNPGICAFQMLDNLIT